MQAKDDELHGNNGEKKSGVRRIWLSNQSLGEWLVVKKRYGGLDGKW
jgi:hypothetical protein